MRRRKAKVDVMAVALFHFAGTPYLLRAAQILGLGLLRDMRKWGPPTVLIAERDAAALIKVAKAERGRCIPITHSQEYAQ